MNGQSWSEGVRVNMAENEGLWECMHEYWVPGPLWWANPSLYERSESCVHIIAVTAPSQGVQVPSGLVQE